MAPSPDTLRDRLTADDFEELFVVDMGWDNPPELAVPQLDAGALRAEVVADKKGVTAFRVMCESGLPKRSEQHSVVRELRRMSRDQLIVFVAPDEHLWLWPEQRASGVGYRLVDHRYPSDAPSDAVVQRLLRASFDVAEESKLTSSSVLDRVRRSFNAEKVTRSFYREFQSITRASRAALRGSQGPGIAAGMCRCC